MRVRVKPVDTRHFWKRRSLLGENISNGNWIIATILLLLFAGAIQQGWIVAAIGLGVAGLLSIVWNEGVAKTTTIIGVWLVVGGATAWLLGLASNYAFGMDSIGHFIGLVVAIAGVVITID